jgi:hypothetical protein
MQRCCIPQRPFWPTNGRRSPTNVRFTLRSVTAVYMCRRTAPGRQEAVVPALQRPLEAPRLYEENRLNHEWAPRQ